LPVDAEVEEVSDVGGGVELCALNPAERPATVQAMAKLTRTSLVDLMFMVLFWCLTLFGFVASTLPGRKL